MVANTQAQAPAADLTWAPGTVKVHEQILPCQRGISADGMTAVEIVGNDNMTIAVTLVGILTPTQEAVTRRNAAYAGLLISKIAPSWKGAHAWLAGRLREMRKKPHAEIRASGWHITLDFNAATSTLTFRATR
jgi:hypothetical protein